MLKKYSKLSLNDEIKETEAHDQHETVRMSVTTVRSLYLHALYAVRDRDYTSISSYLTDLLRRDKQAATPPQVAPPSGKPT